MNEGWLYATVMLGEALLHYIRWREVLLGRTLHPVLRYVLGVLAMMVPFTFWLTETDFNNEQIAWILWKTIVSAGTSVVICYGVDALIDRLWNDKHKIEQLEQQVKVKDAASKQA